MSPDDRVAREENEVSSVTSDQLKDDVEHLKARWINSGKDVTETTLRVVWQTMMDMGYDRSEITRIRGEVLKAINE